MGQKRFQSLFLVLNIKEANLQTLFLRPIEDIENNVLQ